MMFPTHTNFEIRIVTGKKVLVAVTTFTDMVGAGFEKVDIVTMLGQLVDKEYPMPIRFRILQDRIIFEDLEFEKVFRGDIL